MQHSSKKNRSRCEECAKQSFVKVKGEIIKQTNKQAREVGSGSLKILAGV